MPAYAHAGIFADFFAAISGIANAQTTSSSSPSDDGTDTADLQTLALPQPAVNVNPSPTSTPAVTIADNSAVVPQDGPAGTSADVAKTQNGAISTYVVQQGDTLSSIAQLFGVTQNTIRWANDLNAKATIQTGQTLVILPITGIAYTVQKGDTLESIAKKTGSDAGDIASYNGVDDSSLVVGQQLIIPNGESGVSSASSGSSSPSSGAAKPSTVTTKKKTTASPAASSKVVPSAQILQGSYASCDGTIPLAGNPDEPSRGVGPAGTCAQIQYYTSPLAHFTQTQNIHGYNAVDLAAPSGTPIMAAADGMVIIARQGGWNGGYGSYVVISHDNGSQTLYAHMSQVQATVGEQVQQGQVIGKVGMTGDATGPHVHFEIRNGIRNPF